METTAEYEEIRKLSMLAAFVDGEGRIGISRSTRPSGNHNYAQQLQVINTDIRLIQWLVENFGGSFPKAIKQEGNRKDVFHWTLSGSNSYKMIKKIRPYLLLKQEQADCAIELYERVSRWDYKRYNPIPTYKIKLAEELWQKSMKLNKRGKDDNSEEEIAIPATLRIRKDYLDAWLKQEEGG